MFDLFQLLNLISVPLALVKPNPQKISGQFSNPFLCYSL
jgi:hypothetical protein